MPFTYALAAVVRRDASTSYTWPTSTPALRANSSTSSRVAPEGSGVNLLNTGSSRIGPRNVNTTAKPVIAAAPGTHQRRPNRPITSTSTAPPPAASAALIAVPLTTSTPQPAHDCVTRPTSLARSRATARSGSATSVVTPTSAAAVNAPVSTGRRPV